MKNTLKSNRYPTLKYLVHTINNIMNEQILFSGALVGKYFKKKLFIFTLN